MDWWAKTLRAGGGWGLGSGRWVKECGERGLMVLKGKHEIGTLLPTWEMTVENCRHPITRDNASVVWLYPVSSFPWGWRYKVINLCRWAVRPLPELIKQLSRRTLRNFMSFLSHFCNSLWHPHLWLKLSLQSWEGFRLLCYELANPSSCDC